MQLCECETILLDLPIILIFEEENIIILIYKFGQVVPRLSDFPCSASNSDR